MNASPLDKLAKQHAKVPRPFVEGKNLVTRISEDEARNMTPEERARQANRLVQLQSFCSEQERIISDAIREAARDAAEEMRGRCAALTALAVVRTGSGDLASYEGNYDLQRLERKIRTLVLPGDEAPVTEMKFARIDTGKPCAYCNTYHRVPTCPDLHEMAIRDDERAKVLREFIEFCKANRIGGVPGACLFARERYGIDLDKYDE